MKKVVRSEGYNYVFDNVTGYFARWGSSLQDDPIMSPYGPEIADIEITTSCSGPEGKVCGFCYKSNTPIGENMSFETFKSIFHNLPKNLTQIAFGADATLKANPDIWKIMDYCRNNDYNKVVPNVTVANVDLLTARKLVDVCGAVAVSRYDNKDICYDTVHRLTTLGLKQTNIHQLLSCETYENVLETIDDIQTDVRLADLNAIVFLSLKKKGRGKGYTPLSQEKFNTIVNKAIEANIPFGFDSCSANKFLRAVKTRPNFDQYATMTEPCESTCFSLYVNVEGKAYYCSFSETPDTGVNLLETEDFMLDVWWSDYYRSFRDKLLTNVDENNLRQCPLFEI